MRGAPPRIRFDYEQWDQIEAQCNAEAEKIKLMVRHVEVALTVLEEGDWVGRSANAFYQEMHTDVLPKLRRLQEALETTYEYALLAKKIWKKAEWYCNIVLSGKIVDCPTPHRGSGSGGTGDWLVWDPCPLCGGSTTLPPPPPG